MFLWFCNYLIVRFLKSVDIVVKCCIEQVYIDSQLFMFFRSQKLNTRFLKN
jgi:hypothetical protein